MKILRTHLIVFFLLSLIACSSSPPQKVKAPQRIDKIEYVLSGAQQMTQIGKNDSAQFSPYLNKIIYLSSERTHSNWQIYEFDLTSKVEKRLTHQDGDVQQVHYFENDRTILYNSTTDEIKEVPETVLPFLVDIPKIQKQKIWQDELSPSEIYLSDLNGTEIERITEQLGFDGFPTPIENGRFIFVSQQPENWQLILKNSMNKSQVVIRESKHIIYSPHFNNTTKQLVWLEFDSQSNTNQLFVSDLRGQKVTPYPLRPGVYQKSIWKSDQEVLLAAKINGADFFEIFHLQLDTSCLQSFIKYEGDTLSPSLSPNNKDLLFTYKSEDIQHIYLTQLPPVQPGCLK